MEGISVKNQRKSRLNKYYAQVSENKSSFERQIERMQHDPIRLYDGANENVSLKPIKAVRLG
jgi:DNA-binding protein H-NS